MSLNKARVLTVTLAYGAITIVVFLLGVVVNNTHPAWAQGVSPITASGQSTNVGPPTNVAGGKVQYDITGGTRPANGPNLFHSFGEFGVPTNNIANFLNDSGRATSNILSRVTGGNPSNIFGTIQTTGFGNANLFLMNPAGILFGPNATLNVGGSVHFTTADYLRLTDGARFNAIPNAAADALLSTAPVAAFGFLASNPATIAVQGSALSVPSGESISIVGGNISIQAGTLEDGTSQAAHLSAPGGQIRLASVASPGEILHPTLEAASNVNGQIFSSMGTLTISDNATLDVSGDAAGTVIIRGGQLIIVDSTISADTVDTNGAPTAIDINMTGDISIANSTVSAITARTSATGDAGKIQISSANLNAPLTADGIILTLIDTHTSGTGKAGNISITTGNLLVTGDPNGLAFFIDSGTAGPGRGGDVSIIARNFQMDNSATISTGDFLTSFFGAPATGQAGNTNISADNVRMTFSQIVVDAAHAGNINISGHELQSPASVVELQASFLSSTGRVKSGTININADQLIASDSQINTLTHADTGGAITITGRVIELSTGSAVTSTTNGDGNAGAIIITATDHVGLFGSTGKPGERHLQ